MPDGSQSRQMPLSELASICADQERDSLAYMGSKLSKQRKDALKYYFAEPFDAASGLQAVPGRSSVVMQEVADTIDWIIPDLLEKFAAGDQAVEFEANDASGEAAAKQATAYINYVFHHDNPGFMILHDFFQDALIQKNGIVKVWWDERASDETRTLEGISNDAYALLREDPDVEIIAHTELPAAGPKGGDTTDYADDGAGGAEGAPPALLDRAAMPMLNGMASPAQDPDTLGIQRGTQGNLAGDEPTHDVRYRVKSGRCCVENVPPEEFLIARDAKRIATTAYCAHRRQISISDLIAEGYDPGQCKMLPSDDDSSTDDEALERREGDDDSTGTVDREGVMRLVWVTEHYILVDYDGDGIAERRRVVTAGNGTTVLRRKNKDGEYEDANEEWEGPPPFASITPKPKSHRFYGRSIADITMDLQRIMSALIRQMLDNAYAQNNPRHAISEYVNVDDYMSPRLGAFIRMMDGKIPGEGHIQPINVPFFAEKMIGVVEYMEAVKENRTGVTKYNQGTDADSLNKTARGITQIMSAAQKRIQLIARIFAETGVSDLFMLILKCVSTYQKKARVIKVAGQWVPMDPRGWESMFTMKSNVGLGTGNKDQQMLGIQAVGNTQKLLLDGGKTNIVSDENLYNTARRTVEFAGLKNPELYFTDPKEAPPQQPKPDPEMMQAQKELEIKERESQANIALKREETTATIQLQREKQEGEMALKFQGQQMDQAIVARGQMVDHQMAREGAEADRQMQREGMQQEQQGRSQDVDRAIDHVGEMLKEFMQQQKERDQRQDQVLAMFAAKLGLQGEQVTQ